MRYTEYHAEKAVIKDKSKLSEAMEKLAKLEDEEESVLKNHKKNKVTDMDIIVGMIDGKPYYELKYKLLGKDNYNVGYGSYLLDNVVKWKEKYFELVEKENVSKWISCSEKMPEDNTNVIVCFYSGTVTEMRYWGNGIFQGIYEHTAKTIVAWMPLPEPYKGE